MKKRGLILPTVLVLISVLVLLALTRHFFSRQQLHFADLLSEKEQAYYIAAGLREIAVKKLRQTLDFLNSGRPETFPKLEKCELSCRPLLEKLLSESGEPAGKAFNITLKNNALDENGEEIYFKGQSLLVWQRPDDKAFAPVFFKGSSDESSMKKVSGSNYDAVQNTYRFALQKGRKIKLEISGQPENSSYVRIKGPLE